MNSTPPPPTSPAAVPVSAHANASQSRGIAAPCDGGTLPARPVTAHSGAFSVQERPEVAAALRDLPPDASLLRRILRQMEAAWLADLSTAPHDDQAEALLAAMPLTWQSAAVCLEGLDPRFLRGLLLRGVQRLWAFGPAGHSPKTTNQSTK